MACAATFAYVSWRMKCVAPVSVRRCAIASDELLIDTTVHHVHSTVCPGRRAFDSHSVASPILQSAISVTASGEAA